MITRETVSEKLLAYLNEQITLAELVNWAESCFVEGGFMPEAADRPNFPLTWDVCSAGVKKKGHGIAVSLRFKPVPVCGTPETAPP